MSDEVEAVVHDQGRGSIEETARTVIAERLAAFREHWDELSYKDTESVKRMRVASRRLQAAVDAFGPFYKHRKRVKGVRAWLKSMTAALGEARDAAVLQLRLREWLGPQVESLTDTLSELRERELEALDYLSTVAGHEGKERLVPISDMLLSGRVNRSVDEADSVQGQPGDEIGPAVTPLLRFRLGTVVEAMAAAESDPDGKALHELRIAVKKLRYTVELFSYFLPPADATLKVLREVQTMLGEIHDADVLLGLLTADSPAQATVTARRATLHKEYEDYMARLQSSGKWQRIESSWAALLSQQPGPTEAELNRSGGVAVEDWPHARQTEQLALSLYDQLAALRPADAEERRLLAIAAFLHNAGAVVNEKEHHKHSYRIIRKAKLAGFDAAQSEEVAVIARYHRRSLPDPRHPEFAALSKEVQGRVERLAALLRIADALDYQHAHEVTELRLTVGPELVTLRLIGEADLSEDVAKARVKADLFLRAYGRAIEIVGPNEPPTANEQVMARPAKPKRVRKPKPAVAQSTGEQPSVQLVELPVAPQVKPRRKPAVAQPTAEESVAPPPE